MKIHINRHGLLSIERVGKLKVQLCPYSAPELTLCGDWRPLLGEPVFEPGGDSTITICQGRVLSGEIVDERPRKEGKP